MKTFIGVGAVWAAVFVVAAGGGVAWAHEGHEHTHIGLNEDGIFGTADDQTLWLFSDPDEETFPGWPVLTLERQEGFPWGGAYVCEFLYCWHSAHPESGAWQLGGTDEGTVPEWRIALERVDFDEGFGMCTYDTLDPVLTSDGDQYVFDLSHGMTWFDEEYGETGTLGAWGFEDHLYFYVEGSYPVGTTFTATFRAVDVRTSGEAFAASEPFTLTFVTVPEPATLGFLAVGGLAAAWRRRRKGGRLSRLPF